MDHRSSPEGGRFMVKRSLVMSVAALVVTLTVVADASAQRRGWGRGGGYGYSVPMGNYSTFGWDSNRGYYPYGDYSMYSGNWGRSGLVYDSAYPTYSYGRRGILPRYN